MGEMFMKLPKQKTALQLEIGYILYVNVVTCDNRYKVLFHMLMYTKFYICYILLHEINSLQT